jgi:hypothetical protein
MNNLQTSEVVDDLKKLGYDTFSKQIMNHSEFVVNNAFTYWQSYALSMSDTQRPIDYNKFLPPKELLDEEYAIEPITVSDFLGLLSTAVVDIKVCFTKDIQALVCYAKSLSARSVYAWDNNVYVTHLTDNYYCESNETWTCNISKYNLIKETWYPVNLITHSPWHNRSTGKNDVIDINYVCLGIDQIPEAMSIDNHILPDIHDLRNIGSCPKEILKKDLRNYVSQYNRQMQNEIYKFDNTNKSGWLFVAIEGFIYTKDIIVMATDKHNKKRYFSFV